MGAKRPLRLVIYKTGILLDSFRNKWDWNNKKDSLTKKYLKLIVLTKILMVWFALWGIIDDFWFSQAIKVNQKVNINWGS